MRTYILTSFVVEVFGAVVAMIAVAAVNEKRWLNLFNAFVALGFSAWAAFLLWR